MSEIKSYKEINKYIWVYSRTLSDFLRENGLKVLEIRKDAIYPNKYNWKFAKTEEYFKLVAAYEADKIMEREEWY